MLSDVDLKDWIRTKQPVKLHDAPRNTVISTTSAPEKPFWFQQVDGMYSLCNELNGDVFHIAAWTEVFPWIKKKGK
jgi:hypothetical protein